MEIKRFGCMQGKTIMLLHGNLMCWRQFEDLIRLLEKNSGCMLSALTALTEQVKRPTRLPGIRQTSWRVILKKSLTDGWICFLQSRWAVDQLFF